MSAIVANASATVAMLRRDVLIFASYRIRLITIILSSLFSLTLFYYVSRLVRVEPFGEPDAYYAFAVIGLVILSVLNSTLGTPSAAVRQELVAGTFERIALSPFGPVGGLLAMLAFPFCFSLLNALLVLTLASLVFGLDVQWSTAPLAIPLAAYGALSFLPFGIMLLAVTLLAKQAIGGTTWVVAAISLVAGLYFPVSLLPGWIEWASHVQPFTPATELLRHALVGTPLVSPAWESLVKMGAFTVVLLPASLMLVRGAMAVGRRRGTLIEY